MLVLHPLTQAQNDDLFPTLPQRLRAPRHNGRRCQPSPSSYRETFQPRTHNGAQTVPPQEGQLFPLHSSTNLASPRGGTGLYRCPLRPDPAQPHALPRGPRPAFRRHHAAIRTGLRNVAARTAPVPQLHVVLPARRAHAI